MSRREHVLVIDDDPEIRTLLRDYLQRSGLRATAVHDGPAMWVALGNEAFDLLVLDVMLPGDDGFALCRELRTYSTVPIIMLSARGEETDRVVGLEVGADDYVAKPFSPRELLARIKAVLRRTKGLPPPVDRIRARRVYFAGWTFDAVRRQLISTTGVAMPLPSSEYRLLKVLLEYPNQVLNRDRLLDLTRGRDAMPFDRSIDVQIGRLRRRLGDQDAALIQTVRGEGYVLATEVATEC